MRKISEQELKDILDKHGKWLRNEEGGERADLSSADLRWANLRSADLRWANLRSADLRWADLSSADLRWADLSSADLRSANLRWADLSSADLRWADLRWADLSSADIRSANLRSADLRSADLRWANLLVFQFNRHQAFFTKDGMLRIGCIFMPISEWLIGYEEIAKAHNYSEIETEAYGDFIKSCAKTFEKWNGGLK